MSKSETKTAPVRIKSTGDEEGYVEAVVSVFNNIDSYGDVVRKGAFSRSLKEWEDSGDSLPVLWSHELNDPWAHIGHIETAIETDEGLQVGMKLDLENPTARQVYKLLKGRRLREFSFGFRVRDFKNGEVDGISVRELLDVDIFEVSPTLLGANSATRVIEVRSKPNNPEAKEDSPTESKAELQIKSVVSELTDMRDRINEILTNLQPEDETEDSTEHDEQATANVDDQADEEPSEAKSVIDQSTAVANAEALEIYLKAIQIESMINNESR